MGIRAFLIRRCDCPGKKKNEERSIDKIQHGDRKISDQADKHNLINPKVLTSKGHS